MNLNQLRKDFGTQKKCIAYLEKIRWGKTPLCAHCGSDNVTKRIIGYRWHCNSCRNDYSVLIDTIFEGTRLPLPQFFQAMFIMNNAKMGMSASELSKLVGIKYNTAWYVGHRVRCAMIDNEIRLEGIVEFDEAYIGGRARNKKSKDNDANLSGITSERGRGTSKVPIVGAVEKKGKVYVKIIEKLTRRNLLAMLRQVVNTKESIVITDSFKSYKAFDDEVTHISINKAKDGYGHGMKTINTIEGFWSILKNGIKGSYRSISKKYLPFYLAEFTYKYNNRHLQKDSFLKLLENAVVMEPKFVNYKPIGNPKQIVYNQ
ncbi:IS1595 family transposase [Flavobacterium sp. MAH-1]|uniref:IS1595 family transposase n=1 Tax=Flavobacterium agri TaxID=2743471 RepID=A0A7Y8Y293_9FLAO|nr:IS1595 family transposase [Flavobacterium agri]NUY81026.1 IS1595 family transposase [Flavobacterium agri]NYA71050.1 IS1595 family transposase [Flavobacterium agri]